MKKLVSLTLAVLLLATALFTLTSCGSSYGAIEKRLKDAGYTVVDTTDEDGKSYLSFTSKLEEGEVSGTIHVLKAGKLLGGSLRYAVIIEFGADADAKKAMAQYLEDKDVKSFFEDVQSADCVNGELRSHPRYGILEQGCADRNGQGLQRRIKIGKKGLPGRGDPHLRWPFFCFSTFAAGFPIPVMPLSAPPTVALR